MSLFPTKTVYVKVPAETPPTLHQVFNGAAASSDYARSMFADVIEELTSANAELDDVEIRATSEIDTLTALRDEAAAQRRRNMATIENLTALVG